MSNEVRRWWLRQSSARRWGVLDVSSRREYSRDTDIEVVEASEFDKLAAELFDARSILEALEETAEKNLAHYDFLAERVNTLESALRDRDKLHEEHVQTIEADRLRLKAEINRLGYELDKSRQSHQARLAEAEKVIEFYAKVTEFSLGEKDEEPTADGEPFTKRARAYLDKWGSK